MEASCLAPASQRVAGSLAFCALDCVANHVRQAIAVGS